MSSSCPSSPTSRSLVSLSYSNRPRKRLSSADNHKNINTSLANTDSSQTAKAPSPIQTIQHHVIKGRISPIMVARKIFTAHQDTASQQLMGTRKPTHSVSCPSSPTLSPSTIPVGPSSSAPASTSISTRTARPSFARRTSAPSLLVSALVASHANSREKLSQDAGGQNHTEQEESSPCSPRIPIESVPTISVTAVVENSPEATTTNDGGDKGDTSIKKSCGAPPLRPALKHSTSDPQGSSVQRKSVQFETKFERIRHFLRAETPHAVTLSPTSLGPKPKKDTGSIVLPNFPPLTTCYHSKPVSMESLSLSPDGTYIHGLVQVQNLAYEKIVFARYSFDCWNTAHETTARYKEPIIPSDSNHRGLDRFEFSIPIPHRLDSADDAADLWRTMYMAVQYQVDGTQYWDSNSGQNYQINIRQPPPQYFEEDEDVDQGIFHLSDLGIADDDSQENSPDLSSSPRKMMGGKPLSVPASSSDFGYFAPKSPLSAISSTGTIPLRTVKKNLGNRYDFGASLAATVRPRSSPPSFSNPMYHRPSSPLSFSSYSSSKASSTPSSQIPTSSPKSSPSSRPYSSPIPVTSPSARPPASFPFMSSSSVEAPISSTPWEERARTTAVTYRRPSSPSCDLSSNNPASYDSSFPGIPSAWTSYSPSGASPFDAKYPGSVNSLSSSPTQPYHQPYSPLSSSPYSSSPPATAIWG